MRIYNRYIITVAILLLLTTVILVALGIRSLDVYYTSYVMEALIITELYRHFSPRARSALNMVGIVLLVGFLLIALSRIIKMIA